MNWKRLAAPTTLAILIALAAPAAAQTPLFVLDTENDETTFLYEVDPATRVFKVEATMEEGIDRLKPGMSVTVMVDFSGEPQVAVPSLAIQWNRGGSFVWTLDGDAARRLPVEIVGRRSGMVIVAGDIAPDTEVVVEGLQRLRDGAKVKRVGGEAAGPADKSV